MYCLYYNLVKKEVFGLKKEQATTTNSKRGKKDSNHISRRCWRNALYRSWMSLKNFACTNLHHMIHLLRSIKLWEHKGQVSIANINLDILLEERLNDIRYHPIHSLNVRSFDPVAKWIWSFSTPAKENLHEWTFFCTVLIASTDKCIAYSWWQACTCCYIEHVQNVNKLKFKCWDER